MDGMTLMQASRQWATRPDDERFVSLPEMLAAVDYTRQHSFGKAVSTYSIEAAPLAEDESGKALVVRGPDGAPAAPTHWAFGQLAHRAGAPAGYMRELPAPLAADCLNYGLKYQRAVDEVGVLLYRNGGAAELRAVTGPNYGRIWNADVIRALMQRFGDGATGDWKVPGEFGHDVPITKANTTLFASDRDMFVFLADEKHRIEMPNRRDGKPGSLARGFFVWNSEVGKSSYGIAMFLFDYVCCNRIVWGAQQYHEIRGRHTSAAPDRWLTQVMPAIRAYANASEKPVLAAIEQAQRHRIGDVADFLRKRFTQTQAAAIQSVHMSEEGRPIETLWDAATGVTAYAKGIMHQDARVDLERSAGELLDMAA